MSDQVIRGGSWTGHVRRVRAADRRGNGPGFDWSNLGFRIAAASEGRVRGGSWYNLARNIRAAGQDCFAVNHQGIDLGFRVAQDVEERKMDERMSDEEFEALELAIHPFCEPASCPETKLVREAGRAREAETRLRDVVELLRAEIDEAKAARRLADPKLGDAAVRLELARQNASSLLTQRDRATRDLEAERARADMAEQTRDGLIEEMKPALRIHDGGGTPCVHDQASGPSCCLTTHHRLVRYDDWQKHLARTLKAEAEAARLIEELGRLREATSHIVNLVNRALGTPCSHPSCDGVEGDKTYGDIHRHFKDGRWLDDGSEM